MICGGASVATLVTSLALAARAEVGQEALDESFTLRVGETARVESAGIEIKFEEVVSDSRCPTDVNCIRAGEAVVRFSVEAGAGHHERLQFKVPPAGSDSARFRDLLITILELKPQTESGKRIDPSAYEARVRVSRA